MKKMILTSAILLMVIDSFAQNQSEENWIQLFNGIDLNDWHVKINGYETDDNFGNTFYVEDGLMKVGYSAYDKFDDRFGHIFYRQPFSYYKIVVEYRFVGEQAPEGPGWAYRNSGIMVHCQPPNTMQKDQNFPISIEVQLLGGDGENKRPTANVCTPGTEVVMNGEMLKSHCLNSTSKTYHGDQWVKLEVVVMGDGFISHIMEGDEVLYYTAPQIGGGTVSNFDQAVKEDGKPLTGGYISLQSESHPIEFRKVELLDLEGCMDPKAKNYKTYYVKSNKSRCVYD